MGRNHKTKLADNKKSSPLVSVIIPTRNSAEFLDACLKSIKNQIYKNIEIIVVDNYSTDKTKEIAKKYTDKVFNKGPERSAQRNYGTKQAEGKYFLFIDSDMELDFHVVDACVSKINYKKVLSLVIPEKSVGVGFWAECKALERSFYIGVDWMEAARFFNKDVFKILNGYDEKNTGTEDYDLPQRLILMYDQKSIGRINEYIIHNEGRLSLTKTLSKKWYYGKNLHQYTKTNSNAFKKQSSIIERYKLYFSQPKKLFKNPLIWAGMILMKTMEFLVGGFALYTQS